ncbi:MAG: sterol desaturase family protein [Aromatoleum sp.]|nr:sterol desaturase family protein [Aromatoleum sp.]
MPIAWLTDVFLPQLEFPALVFAVALPLEFLLPASRDRSYRALGFNLVAAFIYLFMTTLLEPLFAQVLEPARSRLGLMIPVRFPDGVIGSLGQGLAFFLVYDFFYYWWHRGQHRMRWLWVQHRFHHQERWLNVTTVHRVHFTEDLFRIFAILLPMALLFDFKPVTVGWVWTILTLWGYWIHANVRVRLGLVGKWISGPQFHRFHHTPEHMNRNFSAFFPLWDRVFGTYHHPEPNAFPQYTGLRVESDGNTLRDAVAYPFIEWAKALRRVAGRQRGAARR